MTGETGKYIVVAGLVIIVVGIIIWLFHDNLNWIGRLPGDIRVERKNFRFYFPVTTMLLFSLLITVIIQIVRRFF